MLVNLPVTGGLSYIKRTSIQLYRDGTGQITGAFGKGTGRAVQEIVGDASRLLGSDGVMWERKP